MATTEPNNPTGIRAYIDGQIDEVREEISTGGTPLTDIEVKGSLNISEDEITSEKGYRLRTNGSALDLEATGADLLVSNWSGTNFDGTQRSYDRYSADAANVQHAARREFVSSLYGAAVHTIDPTTGVASFGGKNGLTNIRICGFKNSSGAPSSGAWEAGDLVLDSAGVWHLCTASGTPGTWS